jgi:hypothetical protein
MFVLCNDAFAQLNRYPQRGACRLSARAANVAIVADPSYRRRSTGMSAYEIESLAAKATLAQEKAKPRKKKRKRLNRTADCAQTTS